MAKSDKKIRLHYFRSQLTHPNYFDPINGWEIFVRLFVFLKNFLMTQLFFHNYLSFLNYCSALGVASIIFSKNLWNSLYTFVNVPYISAKSFFSKSITLEMFATNTFNSHRVFNSVIEQLNFFFELFDFNNNKFNKKFSIFEEADESIYKALPFKCDSVVREFLLASYFPILISNPYEKIVDLLGLPVDVALLGQQHNNSVSVVSVKKEHFLPKVKPLISVPFIQLISLQYVTIFECLPKYYQYEQQSVLDFIYFGLGKFKFLLEPMQIIDLLKLLEAGFTQDSFVNFLKCFNNFIKVKKDQCNLYALYVLRDFFEFLYNVLLFLPVKEEYPDSPNIKRSISALSMFKELNFLNFNFWFYLKDLNLSLSVFQINQFIFNVFYYIGQKSWSYTALIKQDYLFILNFFKRDVSAFTYALYTSADLEVLLFPYFYEKHLYLNVYEDLDDLDMFTDYMFPIDHKLNLHYHYVYREEYSRFKNIKKKTIFEIKQDMSLLKKAIFTYMSINTKLLGRLTSTILRLKNVIFFSFKFRLLLKQIIGATPKSTVEFVKYFRYLVSLFDNHKLYNFELDQNYYLPLLIKKRRYNIKKFILTKYKSTEIVVNDLSLKESESLFYEKGSVFKIKEGFDEEEYVYDDDEYYYYY